MLVGRYGFRRRGGRRWQTKGLDSSRLDFRNGKSLSSPDPVLHQFTLPSPPGPSANHHKECYRSALTRSLSHMTTHHLGYCTRPEIFLCNIRRFASVIICSFCLFFPQYSLVLEGYIFLDYKAIPHLKRNRNRYGGKRMPTLPRSHG